MQNQYPEDVNGVRRSDLIRPYESRRHREQMHNYSSRDSGNRNQRDDDRESSNRSNRRPRPRRNSSYSRDDDEWNDDSSGQSQQQRQQQRRSRSQDGTQVAEKKSAKKSLWPKRAPDRTDVHSQDAIHRGLGYFDYRSFNGLLAGATGAGFGAITARSIGPNHYKPGQKRETNWQVRHCSCIVFTERHANSLVLIDDCWGRGGRSCSKCN